MEKKGRDNVFNPPAHRRFRAPGAPLFVLGLLTLSTAATAVTPMPSDFNGDGKTDIAVFQRVPETGTPGTAFWNYITSCDSTSVVSFNWGYSTDTPVPASYIKGIPVTNPAVTRPGSSGLVWWIYGISGGQNVGANTDIPVPRDYFAEGHANPATVTPGSGNLLWSLYDEANNLTSFYWGLSSDKLVPADYDGDGAAEAAIFRPSTGVWSILKISDMSERHLSWGLSTDKPVPGDYDGDGKYDVAVYRPGDGTWYILKSTDDTLRSVTWGLSTDVPVQGDYDDDGNFDVAVFRPSTATWYIQYSGGGSCTRQFGDSTDTPVPALYNPQ